MRENSGTMTDIILIKAHRELTKVLSTKVNVAQKSDFLMRHKNGDIIEAVLESMIGHMFDAEQITATETHSFKWSHKPISVLEAMNEDTCLLAIDQSPYESQYSEQVTKSGKKVKHFSVYADDMCVTDKNDTYVTDYKKNSISRLSPSGSVSPVFSTDPLMPVGICQTMEGGLLVTLIDIESDPYQLNSDSQRLLRHVTLTGDVIREYEYQEDGQTRLFTLPRRVTQNGNSDICVINRTSRTTGELVILSFSGSLKSVYPEQEHRGELNLLDVVCDSYSNILVSEQSNSSVHLLSSEGKFMRYLLTENQVNHPTAISLKKSTLWVDDFQGLVKVFQYKL